ncbi:acyltransferase [Pedobacter sp. UBA4863]|uniref:acyltransferase family protein n=1 Tax=Pedobacter sp. UBA4863 TaxID=1947060 RepID=UPI0025EF470F|nr:acyltransferase [Pedobacter sp. UBA4863]
MTYKEQLYNYKTIPSLNGWRAVAVILVLLGHFKMTLNTTSLGYKILDQVIFAELGVRIFFVLSGFLITTLLIKEKAKYGKINIRHFFIRRFLRIVPVLWLYLAVVALLNQLFKFNLTLSHFLGPLLYLNNFNFFPGVWLLGHTWSLAVEEQFYLIWPFIFSFVKNKLLLTLFILIATPVLVVLAYVKPDLSNVLLVPFLRPATAIFCGAVLAILWSKDFFNVDIKKHLNWPTLIFVSVIVFLISNYQHQGKYGKLLLPTGDTIMNLGIAYAITFSLIQQKNNLFRFLNLRLMNTIGLLSYSLYIWQQLFLFPVGSYLNWKAMIPFPLNILLIFIIAYISYTFFEKRFLKLKHQFSSI